MGTIKKYHFVLYISEEQEYAIRQLFVLNKWDLHGKALSQLAATLEAAQNDLTNRTHTGQDESAHQVSVQNAPTPQLSVQNDSCQQLPVQNAPTHQLPVQNATTHQLPVQNAPPHQLPVQNDLCQQLSLQSDSLQQPPVLNDTLKQLPVQTTSTVLPLVTVNENKTNAEQVLSQSLEEIEKEAIQHAGNASLDTCQDVNHVSDRLEKHSVSNIAALGGENGLISEKLVAENKQLEAERKDNNSVSNEVESCGSYASYSRTVNDPNVTVSDVLTTCVGNSDTIQMDPLARASEIAGIPFQQPDGSLYYSPDSVAYRRYENFYQHDQVPVNTDQQQSVIGVDPCSQVQDSVQSEHQQTILDTIETTVQLHGSGIEQLIKASAIVPPQAVEEYSVNDQDYLSCKAITSSFSATEIQPVRSQLPVSSPVTFTAHKFESNIVPAGTSVTELSGSHCSSNETDRLPISNENFQVDGTDMVVTNLCRNSNKVIPREVIPNDMINKQSSVSETFYVDEEPFSCGKKKDFVELNVNGSIVKIPVIKTGDKGILKEDAKHGDSENESIPQQTLVTEEGALKETPLTREKEKESKQTQVIAETEPKVNSPSNVEESIKKKRVSQETKSIESKEITYENKIARLEQEVISKRKKKLTKDSGKISKKQRTEKKAEGRKYSEDSKQQELEKSVKDNMQQESEKHVKKIDGERNEIKTVDKRNKQLIPEVTITYSTRFRTKKEMMETSKKKKRDRERKHCHKKTKSEQENICKKTFKESKNKKNKSLKHENISEKASEKQTSNENRKEVNLNGEKTENKVRSRKSKPKRLKAGTAEKVSETNKDKDLPKEQSDIEDHETDLVKETPELGEIEVKTEVKDEIKDHTHSKLKKFTKTKPSKSKDENDDISTIKCKECGKFCNKKGYCKVCRVSCPHCEKTFTKCPSAMKLYQTHVKKHMNDPKPYPCTECGMKFSSQWFLNRHMINKHINQCSAGPFQCEVCQKRFTTKYSLKGHLSHVHGDRKRDVLCDLCGDFFLSQGYLRQHRQYVHQEERNFTCHLCYVSVKTEVLLKRHLARHTEEKNEVCNICGRSFRVRSDLLRHMVRHDNNRRSFKCETCGKSFFEDQKLKQHVRIHTGVKPFKCNLCPYACAVKGNLTKHLKTHANREGYLGRSYKRKSKLSKNISQIITDPGPVQMHIEVITTNNDHITITQEALQYEEGEQEMPQYESGKQELPYVEMAVDKEELVQYDTGKEKLPHFETGKQEVPHFETGKEELPHFETVKQGEAQFETLRDSMEQEREHYETVRTDTNPVRVYYEAVHPDYIEAGRPYMTQQGIKDYKDLAEGEYKDMAEGEYINQINAMIANNYKNVNKIDFYNI